MKCLDPDLYKVKAPVINNASNPEAISISTSVKATLLFNRQFSRT